MRVTEEMRREAYHAALPSLPKREQEVFYTLKSFGPQTAEELMARLGTHNPNTVRPRLTGLRDRGLIRAVGKRRGADGFQAAVWEVVSTEASQAGDGGRGLPRRCAPRNDTCGWDGEKRGAPVSRNLRPEAEQTERRHTVPEDGLRSRRGLDSVAEGAQRDREKRGAPERSMATNEDLP